MGTETCLAVEKDPRTKLVAAVDINADINNTSSTAPSSAGIVNEPTDTVTGIVSEIINAKPHVVVDFTVAKAAKTNMAAVADAGIHAVIGTSGLSNDDVASLSKAFISSHCMIVPNFAISAVLMMRFAALAAPFFDTAEVIEYHHNRKVDAPSGTAMQTVAAMAKASDTWNTDPTTDSHLPGARGGVGPAGIHVHSVRLKGMLAHQTVLFGGEGETLSIRHDTVHRSAFMPGVLLAVRHVVTLPAGLTVGLENILGF